MENLSKYNPEGSDLRKMQLKMLDILCFIDSVCVKHNISYWLAYGTLLGAARHGGFIPWDDDLDIEMFKDDYDKLLNILKKELPENFILQTHHTDRNFVFPIAKVRDKNSVVYELKDADKNYKYRGIYIDLFYLEKGNTFWAKLTNNIQKVPFFFTLIKNDEIGFISGIRKLTYFLTHSVIFSLIRFFLKFSGCKSYIAAFGTGINANRNIDIILPLQKISFEGKYFNVPNNYEACLKELYGDYMKLPDEGKRRVHTMKIEFL